jgi:DNA-binding NarL/FixJ family response regulator
MQTTLHSGKDTRILLADDHMIVIEGIRSLLIEAGFSVIGVVADGRALLEMAPRLNPDVIVLDVSMPLLNGLDAATKLRQLLPDVKIVFLTMKDDPNLASAVLSLGPVGYVLKHSAASELHKAITEVLRGKSYITSRLKPADWAQQVVRTRKFQKTLTPRQREVLQLLAEGLQAKEVAAVLDISARTVLFHKYGIMKSFNITSNADLVLFAVKEGLISSEVWS